MIGASLNNDPDGHYLIVYWVFVAVLYYIGIFVKLPNNLITGFYLIDVYSSKLNKFVIYHST